MRQSNIIGQQEVIDRLLLFDREGRIPHAMLFVGQQGVGKLAVAQAFAKRLLMKNDPLGNAEAMVDRGSHPDLIYSFPVINTNNNSPSKSSDFIDKWLEMIQHHGFYFSEELWQSYMSPSNKQAIIGVGESNALTEKLLLTASQGGYKVCIIYKAEKMNEQAANKLLKIIEEPPKDTIFILTAEQPQKILETIRSRTQTIEFKPISEEELTQALITRKALQPDDARRVARAAAGSWLGALEIIEEGSERSVFRETYISLMRLAYQKNVLELKEWCAEPKSWGREKQKRFFEYCLLMTRENFMHNFHEPSLCYMTAEEEKFAEKFAPFINESNVLDFNNIYNTAIRDIAQNANANIVLYDLALKVIILLRKK